MTATLTVTDLSKSFPGTKALDGVDLRIEPGEIHALVGQNGCGKSTLIKVLAGYHAADPGSQAFLGGDEFSLENTSDARHSRMRFVHQDLGLFLELSAMDNLALRSGYLTTQGGRVDWAKQAERTVDLLERFDTEIDVSAPLSAATPIQRTIVAIAAALAGWDGKDGLLVLDEPTAILPAHEVGKLLDIVRRVRAQGASVLYVSHRLDEIFDVADRVTVMKNGRVVATRDTSGLTTQTLAELMVDEGVSSTFRAGLEVPDGAQVAVAVEGLTGKFLRGIDFEVRSGEVVGFVGLPGSGAEEIGYLLAGARSESQVDGSISAGGVTVAARNARSLGLAIAPANRIGEGIVAEFSVGENTSISVLGRLRTILGLSAAKENAVVDEWTTRTKVKCESTSASIMSLSGGNQQKVVLARCLSRRSPALVMCEPTAGVDVGSRQTLYELIAEQARDGMPVVVSSTDNGDLMALCTRVIVLYEGLISGELVGDAITDRTLVAAIEQVPA